MQWWVLNSSIWWFFMPERLKDLQPFHEKGFSSLFFIFRKPNIVVNLFLNAQWALTSLISG